jgi:peptidoglycan/LPS O-acetylase OafA/YrhL
MVICNHYRYLTFMRAGWMGVDLFFVLSGFLISALLFSEIQQNSRIKLSRFLIRRGLKIYPAFYFFIAVTTFLSPLVSYSPRLVSELFFLQSYLPGLWGHTWSLAVEEHFYIFLPLVLIALNRLRRMSLLPYIAVALITVCLILRLAVSLSSDNMEAVLFPTHLRVDALFAGVTLGYFFHFRRGEFMALSRWWTGALGLVLLLPSLLTDTINPLFASIQLTYNLAGFCLVVLWASTRSIRVPLLTEIGRYSYSIYLWHLMVTAFWRQHEMSFLSFSGDVIGCLAIGIAMGVMIELPILRLRDRLVPSRQDLGSIPASLHGTHVGSKAVPDNARAEHLCVPAA